jgi:predicted RNase H-like HicB family nuclease
MTTRRPHARKNPAELVNVGSYSYLTVFTPAEEGGYTVTCPTLPGLVTEGDSLREARQRAAEAIAGYLEVLSRDGRPIPRDTARVEPVEVELMAWR